MTYKFKCDNCNKLFNKKMLKKLEIDNDLFICDECDNRFLETFYLNYKKQKCECGGEVIYNFNMDRWVCEECGNIDLFSPSDIKKMIKNGELI